MAVREAIRARHSRSLSFRNSVRESVQCISTSLARRLPGPSDRLFHRHYHRTSINPKVVNVLKLDCVPYLELIPGLGRSQIGSYIMTSCKFLGQRRGTEAAIGRQRSRIRYCSIFDSSMSSPRPGPSGTSSSPFLTSIGFLRMVPLMNCGPLRAAGCWRSYAP
jgi:hypothetical protein